MKKFIKTSLLLTALLTSPLVSCSKDNKNNKTDNKTEVAKVEVTGVTLDQASKSLGVGEEFTLKATIAPENATNKDVTWSSTNPEVATVDSNGKVKTISVGKAEIVAKSNNGKEAKCTVNVFGLELRIRTEEGETAYTDFDITTVSSQLFEYKLHREDGTSSEEWALIDFNNHFSNAKLNNDKSKISLSFTVEESISKGEGEEIETEVKNYSGLYTLSFNDVVKDVKDIKPNEKLLNSDSEFESYMLRGIVIGSYFTDASNQSTVSTPEILLKDINTDDVYGVRGFATKSGDDIVLHGYKKGDEVIINITSESGTYANDDPSGGKTILNTDGSLAANKKSILLSKDNNTQLDIEKATILDTKTKLEEVFATNELRVANMYKLFTLPAGNKYSCMAYSNNVKSANLIFGVGYTSDSREGYAGYGYYNINTENRPIVGETKGSDGTLQSTNIFGLYCHSLNQKSCLGSNDSLVKLLYPERYVEGYSDSPLIINGGQNGANSMWHNREDTLSTKKSLTVMFVGSNKKVTTNTPNGYTMTGVIVLDDSWVR